MKRLFIIAAFALFSTACNNNDNTPGEPGADTGYDSTSPNSNVDTTVAPSPMGSDTALESNRMMEPQRSANPVSAGTSEKGMDSTKAGK